MKNPTTHRLFRDGFTSIARSSAFSFATGVVAFLAASMIVVAILAYGLSANVRGSIASKVHMNVYFFPATDESIVEAFAGFAQSRSEVADVTIVTREEALEAFRARHSNDALTLQALDELNENPLGASVIVRTHEPSQLKAVATLLNGDTDAVKQFYPYIERVNYFDHEQIIDRFNIFSGTLKAIIVATVVGTLLLVILLMYTMAKVHMVADFEMHETKRLLGAEKASIVAPRIISSLIISATSGTLALIVGIIVSWQLTRISGRFFEGFSFDGFLLHSLPLVCAVVYSVLFLCAIATTFVAYSTTSRRR